MKAEASKKSSRVFQLLYIYEHKYKDQTTSTETM